MTTPITITFCKDPDYDKLITVKHGKISTGRWAKKYLTPEERAEWLEQQRIHQVAVQAAIDAGDCVIGQDDEHSTQIKWRNEDAHLKWMSTISLENHDVYQSYWSRYHAKMKELEQKKL